MLPSAVTSVFYSYPAEENAKVFGVEETCPEGAPPPGHSGGVVEALGQATQEVVATLRTLVWKESLQKVRQLAFDTTKVKGNEATENKSRSQTAFHPPPIV